MRIHRHDFVLLKTLKCSPKGLERILEHIGACAKCKGRRKAALQPAADRTGHGPVFDRAFQVFETRQAALAKERSVAPWLFALLKGIPYGRQQILVRNSRRFHTWGLFELLIQEGREETFTDPCHAEEIFRLALAVADQLEFSFYGTERIEDLRGRAWAYIANTSRVRRDMSAAEEVFKEASVRLSKGTRDPLDQAVLSDLKASLRREQLQFGEALALSRRAISIFDKLGESHLAGRACVNLSIAHRDMGNLRAAELSLLHSLISIDPVREPRVALCAVNNLIEGLTAAGQIMKAQRIFAEARPLYRKFPEPSIRARQMWVEAQILAGLGRRDQAEVLLGKARDKFAAAGLPYYRDLASRELASLRAANGGVS